MAGTTNTQQWNPTAANQETDTQYTADSQRAGGASNPSEFDARLANKLFYQVTTYVAALGQMLANKGITNSDVSLAALTTAMSNIITTADIRGNLQSVSYSPSLVFNAALYLGFQVTLSGGTSVAITGQQAGDTITLVWVQDGTGGYGVTYSTDFASAGQPDPAANTISVQTFKVNAALKLEAQGPPFSNRGMGSAQIGTYSPTSGVFTTLALAAGAPAGQVLTGNGTSFTAQPSLTAMTMTDVTGSRTLGGIYHNLTGYPLQVAVTGELNIGSGTGSTVTIQARVGSASPSTNVATSSVTNGSGLTTTTFFVPVGYYYGVYTGIIGPGDTTSATLTSWIEWAY